MAKKILVTGGAGYIGPHVLFQLSKLDCEVVVVDNLSTGRKENIYHGEFIEADLSDTAKLEDIIKNGKFDACIHFAGSIIVPESVENPILYYKNNAMNSLGLIELCIKYKVNKFIFSSTAAVYGDLEGGVAFEETATVPINPYGRSKLMTEWTLEDCSKAYEDFNYIALRYFNVAGANIEGHLGQTSKQSTHLIKLASETALKKRDKLFIFGDDYETPDGTCIRDYIHIDDLAIAHVDALSYLEREKKSHILNCGYGHGYSVKEVVDVVKKVSDYDFPVETVGRRAGDGTKLVANSDKIKSVIGWKPKFDDLDLIAKTALEWESKI
jgi:UDP-glucose 4-epimerase